MAIQVGLVGTGIMGSRMCANLVKAGHAVLAFDASAPAREAARTAGASLAAAQRALVDFDG